MPVAASPGPAPERAPPAGDIRAPDLEDVTFFPDRLTVLDRAKRITVTVRARDDGAGVGSVVVHFRGPSTASITGLATLGLVEGTPGGGVFRGPFEIPAFAEAGTWTLALVRLEDRAGNVAEWDEGALRAGGFQVELRVVRGR